MEDDRVTIEKIISGDTRSFKSIVENHQKLVAHIVFKMVSNIHDREEICQDVFVKVFENLKQFKHQSKLSTWIARIAYNTTLNHIQKKKPDLYEDMVRPDSNEESGSPEFSESVWNASDRSDDTLVASETRVALQKAISELPPAYRTIITLFHQDEMSYDEIGRIMNWPAGTVKSYLFRARKMLKDKLLETYHAEELV